VGIARKRLTAAIGTEGKSRAILKTYRRQWDNL